MPTNEFYLCLESIPLAFKSLCLYMKEQTRIWEEVSTVKDRDQNKETNEGVWVTGTNAENIKV